MNMTLIFLVTLFCTGLIFAQMESPSAQGQFSTNADSFKRDPFRLPQYIIDKLTIKPASPVAVTNSGPTTIDEKADAIRRWSLTEYTLVGIIWDVKNPKALLKDLQNNVHIVKMKDKVGNKEGIVSKIKEGTLIITEKQVPFVLRLKK